MPHLLGAVGVVVVAAVFAAQPVVPDQAWSEPDNRFRTDVLAAASELQLLSVQLRGALGMANAAAERLAHPSGAAAPAFTAAAMAVERAEGPATDAQRRLERLRAMDACAASTRLPDVALAAADLRETEDRFREAAASSEPFALFRDSSALTLQRLEGALVALRDGDPELTLRRHAGAAAALDAARDAHGTLDVSMPTASIWFDVMGRVLAAVADMARAELNGDAAAADRAAAEYAEAGRAAPRADRARSVALAEGASAIVSAAAGGAAASVREVERAAGELAALARAPDCG